MLKTIGQHQLQRVSKNKYVMDEVLGQYTWAHYGHGMDAANAVAVIAMAVADDKGPHARRERRRRGPWRGGYRADDKLIDDGSGCSQMRPRRALSKTARFARHSH